MGKIEGRRFLSERPALCSVPPARSTHRMEIEALSCPLGEKLGVERGCSPRTGSGQDRKKQKNARGSEKNGTGQSHGRVSPFFKKIGIEFSKRCHPEVGFLAEGSRVESAWNPKRDSSSPKPLLGMTTKK
ncbi:MAG: hypothetical protein AB7U27_13735 [Aminobacteriaceae bacterium]|jgi:hypothetical protein|nr:hypothetical protein [Synergistaceae bacterium]